jgi:hypothetical protein
LFILGGLLDYHLEFTLCLTTEPQRERPRGLYIFTGIYQMPPRESDGYLFIASTYLITANSIQFLPRIFNYVSNKKCDDPLL